MEPNEVHEMHEHAEQAAHNRALLPVTLSMSILAVLVAMATLMSHRAHTEEIVLKNDSTDKWNYYQAKNIRKTEQDDELKILSVVALRDEEGNKKIVETDTRQSEKWTEDLNKLKEQADEADKEVKKVAKQATHFDLGEVLLEIALILTSITLLTNHRGYWIFGVVLALAGIVAASMGFLIH